MGAATSASKYNLDNLIVIIDRNKLQITGGTEEVNPIEPLSDKFVSFGFNVQEVNGNNVEHLLNIFQKIPFQEKVPNMIIANTTKGAGISFIENQVSWHHKVPTKEELDKAFEEIEEGLKNV